MRFFITLEAEADNLDAICEFAQAVRDDVSLLRHMELEEIALLGMDLRTTHQHVALQPGQPGLRLTSEHPGGLAYRPEPGEPAEELEQPEPGEPAEELEQPEPGEPAPTGDD